MLIAKYIRLQASQIQVTHRSHLGHRLKVISLRSGHLPTFPLLPPSLSLPSLPFPPFPALPLPLQSRATGGCTGRNTFPPLTYMSWLRKTVLRALLYLLLPYLTLPNLSASNLTLCNPTSPNLTLTYLILPYLNLP